MIMLRLLLLSLLLTVPGVRAPAQADPFEPSVTREESEWIRAAVATATTNATSAATQLAALRTDASSAAVDFTLGNLHFQAAQHESAAAAYQASLRKFPRFRAARVNLSRAQLLLGRNADAVTILQSLVADAQADADTYLLLGHVLQEQNAPVSAESAHRQALLLRAGDLEALLGLARALLPQDRPAESLALAGEILDRDPLRREVWVLKANSLLQLDRPADAAQALEAARRLGLADAEMLALLGDLHLDARRIDDALACYEKAFTGAAPSVPRLLRALEAFLLAGHPEAAARMNDRLAGLTLEPAQRLEWLRLAARLAVAQGRSDDALARLQELLREHPLDGRALLDLAALHQSADRLEDAVLACERAARIPDAQVEALVLHAQIEVRRARYAPAVDLLESAQALRPDDRVQRYLDQVRRLRDR